MRRIVKLGYLMLVLLLSAAPAKAQQRPPGFYIDDGTSITWSDRGDPGAIKVIEWYIKLYPQGAPTGGPGHWGMITGATMEEVLESLRGAQAFEERFERWSGRREERFTHRNPFGPVARVAPAAPGRLDELKGPEGHAVDLAKRLIEQWQSQVEDSLWDQLGVVGRMFRWATGIDLGDADGHFSNSGTLVREYQDLLIECRAEVLRLRTMLTGFVDSQGAELGGMIAQFQRHTEALPAAQGRAHLEMFAGSLVAGECGAPLRTALGWKTEPSAPFAKDSVVTVALQEKRGEGTLAIPKPGRYLVAGVSSVNDSMTSFSIGFESSGSGKLEGPKASRVPEKPVIAASAWIAFPAAGSYRVVVEATGNAMPEPATVFLVMLATIEEPVVYVPPPPPFYYVTCGYETCRNWCVHAGRGDVPGTSKRARAAQIAHENQKCWTWADGYKTKIKYSLNGCPVCGRE